MSGHSKWSTIKRRKGAKDQKRGRMFTKLIKEITVAARMGGGDPNANARLRRALEEARLANLPADNLTRAIKKGTGELEGVNYDELVYEGVGPSGMLVIIDVMTDNRNRTAAELRKIFEKHNGQLSAAGAAAWAFDAKGMLHLPSAAASEEQLFEVAVAAGAEDLQNDGEQWLILTPVDALETVRAAVVAAHFEIHGTALVKVPKTAKVLSGRDAEVGMDLVETLEEHDDVQKVFTDFEPADEAVAALS